MSLRHTALALAVMLATAGSARAILIVGDPVVIEEYQPTYDRVEYTVDNPSVSNAGDIIALLVEFDPDVFNIFNSPWTDTSGTNAWDYNIFYDGYTDPETQWDGAMIGHMFREYGMTYAEMFGSADYPYASTTPAAVYWVPYTETAGSFDLDDTDAAVEPGESQDGFYVYGGGPCSTFYAAHIPDASETFDEGDVDVFSGETVPEPATLTLLAAGAAVSLLRRRR